MLLGEVPKSVPCCAFRNFGDLLLYVMIVGSDKVKNLTKDKLMSCFECTDKGEMMEFLGSRIEHTNDGGLKFTQPVLIQSFSDKFKLPTQKFNTPTKAGDILTYGIREEQCAG